MLASELVTSGMSFTVLPNRSNDIGMLSMEADGARKPLLQAKFQESNPQISPAAYTAAKSCHFSGMGVIQASEINSSQDIGFLFQDRDLGIQ